MAKSWERVDGSDNGTPYESVPTTVQTDSPRWNVEVTAEQARRMAAMLIEAEDLLDRRS